MIPNPTAEARIYAIEALAQQIHAGFTSGTTAAIIATGLVHPDLTVAQSRTLLLRLGSAWRAGDRLAIRRATWHLLNAPGTRPDPFQLDTRNRPVETVGVEQPAAVAR